MIIGKGAGGPETASSLLRDLLEIRGKINGSPRRSGVQDERVTLRLEIMKVVMKFGGSSVASADRINNVADSGEGEREGAQVVVVCSAMGDTTDELLALCADASKGLEKPVEERLASIRESAPRGARRHGQGGKPCRRQVLAIPQRDPQPAREARAGQHGARGAHPAGRGTPSSPAGRGSPTRSWRARCSSGGWTRST